MYSHAVNAYKQVDKNTNSGRETEARVLTEAALKLKRCQENWGHPDLDDQFRARPGNRADLGGG